MGGHAGLLREMLGKRRCRGRGRKRKASCAPVFPMILLGDRRGTHPETVDLTVPDRLTDARRPRRELSNKPKVLPQQLVRTWKPGSCNLVGGKEGLLDDNYDSLSDGVQAS